MTIILLGALTQASRLPEDHHHAAGRPAPGRRRHREEVQQVIANAADAV